jgi:hypothetical protein
MLVEQIDVIDAEPESLGRTKTGSKRFPFLTTFSQKTIIWGVCLLLKTDLRGLQSDGF